MKHLLFVLSFALINECLSSYPTIRHDLYHKWQVKDSCKWKLADHFVDNVYSQCAERTCSKVAETYAFDYLYSEIKNKPIQASLQWLLDCNRNDGRVDRILRNYEKDPFCINKNFYPRAFNGKKTNV